MSQLVGILTSVTLMDLSHAFPNLLMDLGQLSASGGYSVWVLAISIKYFWTEDLTQNLRSSTFFPSKFAIMVYLVIIYIIWQAMATNTGCSYHSQWLSSQMMMIPMTAMHLLLPTSFTFKFTSLSDTDMYCDRQKFFNKLVLLILYNFKWFVSHHAVVTIVCLG